MTEHEIWAARKERARQWRQAGGDLRGYLALRAEEESDETLNAQPPEHQQKKPKADQERSA